MRELLLGVEVGGTFTDWVLVQGHEVVKTGKVLTTPKDPAKGVLEAVGSAGVALDEVHVVLHGSTLATNAVLERKGAKTAMITTKGFGDILEIQRQARSRLFDLFYRHPQPVVSRDRMVEITERMGPGGEIRCPLSFDGLEDRVREMEAAGNLESVGVCLLHSYANPQHEIRIAEFLEERFPNLFVTRSSEILPSFREYERMSTCAISAYVKPLVDHYIARLEDALGRSGFAGRLSVVQANGGAVPASEMRRHAARMILSGPAAGVIAAIAFARAQGIENILTIDMGGTSTDVCLVTDGEHHLTTEYKVGGLPLALPMIDIVTVGAGGGSIASVDRGGAMKVGPESAGADPGPACYDKGGSDFTVTDSNVVLGLLRPSKFFGGRLTLSPGAALSALKGLVERMGMSLLDIAEGVVRLANATMAQAMRLVSVERGFDPRDYTVVAYGGAGPLHAAALAEELGSSRVLVPFNPGLISAYGLMLADTRQDFLQTQIMSVPLIDREAVAATFRGLRDQAQNEFDRYRIGWEQVELKHSFDMRYKGQAYELVINVDDLLSGGPEPEALIRRFEQIHRHRYGHAPGGNDVEIVNFRLGATCPSALHAIDSGREHRGGGVKVEEGLIFLQGRETRCSFFQRPSLPVDFTIEGPAVVEEPTATTFVPPGWEAHVDSRFNMLLTRGGT